MAGRVSQKTDRVCRSCRANSPCIYRVAHQAHMQAVLKNPAFRKNPFEAIRIHASNSMVMQEKS